MTNYSLLSHKYRFFVGIAICLLAAVILRVEVNSAEVRDGIDAILVIDSSGSMLTSDRERTALEAAKLFIDMMETRNSRVGIIEFTNVLGTVIPLTPVNTIEERDELKDAIDAIEYGGWTDIGLAMEKAAEMMIQQGDPDNSPMIILFTDGDIDLGLNQVDRTDAMSYSDVWWAVEALTGQVPIYTIGLNYHGDVNVNFLRNIADQTLARSFIVDQAAGLPLIFSEIFASHIRSSLTEIAEFTAVADEYRDVIIPIPSAFVQEANIIMLSENPLINVRLTDPEGQEVGFDGEQYIHTYANRYSMVKLITPAVGDWTLSVMGVPDDRVTVNLIYSFDVNISVSVSQANVPGPSYNPEWPITVNAGFIFADPRIDPQELYADSQAQLLVFDSGMQLLYTLDMINTGANFTVEYVTEADLEAVHLTVFVQNPDFETSSAYFTVNFGDPLDFEETVPATPEPVQTPAGPAGYPPEPGPPPPQGSSGPPIGMLIIGAVIIAGAVAIFLFKRGAQPVTTFFCGYLEVRALLEDGMYTALEAPDLSTFIGRTSLYEFLSLTLKSQTERVLQSINIGDVYIQPVRSGEDPAIELQNKGNCQIQNEEGNTIDASRKFHWMDNQRLVFSNGSNAKLEVTYRSMDD